MAQLPYDVIEAMVQCFGRCFHYKDLVAAFMLSAGVSRQLVDKYRDQAKFVWARRVLTELGQVEAGHVIQRRVLMEFMKVRNVPDAGVADPSAGLDALRKLKQLAVDRNLAVKKEKASRQKREDAAAKSAALVQERAGKLAQLRDVFFAEATTSDRQHAGYAVEDILVDLFSLFEIEYRKSYRTDTQQIDGHFRFDGFDYLVEAKWRRDRPTEQEIGGFKQKVDSKLESTRGLFVSIEGFRPEVVCEFDGRGANIIFMDGADLTCILEGHFDLRDALRLKIDKAAQYGRSFAPLTER